MNVFVINMHGEPLMPCSPRKARLLLKKGKAKVVQREPFAIQLLHGSSGYKQSITIGVDTGVKEVGISVKTDSQELFSSVFKLRDNISSNIQIKSMYRRARRNRLRYRQPRFNNRAASKESNKLSPSVRHKIESHKRIINYFTNRLPKTKLIIELSKFDTQKIQNPSITNIMYQQGKMYNYENTRQYILDRDNYKCQCQKKGCSKKLEIHHIQFKSKGGSDNPDNLITLCSKHHKDLHSGKISLNVGTHKELKSATIMNMIRKILSEYYTDSAITYGYITKVNRLSIGIEKTHNNDAFVIAGGTTEKRAETVTYKFKQGNNRYIGINRNGFAPTDRKIRYPIQSGDVVEYKGRYYKSFGNSSKGLSIILYINGFRKSVGSNVVNLVYNRKNIQKLIV